MQDADDLIDVVLKDRQAGVLAVADDAFDLCEIIVQIDADYFIVRNHDVVDRDFLEVEDTEQHLLKTA